MRIVHVADYFQPGIGYQEYYLAVCQAAAGHDVSVVTSDRYLPFPDYARTVEPLLGPRVVGSGSSWVQGVEVHRLPCRFEYRRNSLWLVGLEDKLRRIKPDVVSVDGVFTLTAGRVARMNRRLMFPLVFDSHAAPYNTAMRPSRVYQLRLALFRMSVVPWIKAEADALIAIDEGTREMLSRELELPADTIPIIPLGADTKVFRPDPVARKRFRERHDLSDRFVIAFTSKLHPEKGAHLVLEGARRLASRLGDTLRVVIVGNGPAEYVSRLTAISEEPELRGRVTFIRRFLDRNELNEMLNGADVGVWPMEPSNVIQEAMAAGLPIVMPDRNLQGVSNASYVPRHNGILFRRGSVESLEAVLLELATDSESRQGMGRRAREYIEADLSWEAIAERFVREFERAIEIRARRHSGIAGPYARVIPVTDRSAAKVAV